MKSSDKKTKNKEPKIMSTMKKIAKIDRLPKDVVSSIPIQGIMPNGIIETYAGTFTKSYKLQDVNFDIAPDEEQYSIFTNFMGLLNSFREGIKWQFCIYNHEIDKRATIDNIRIAPRRDGLNKYRQELNGIMFEALASGSGSYAKDKYLTIAIEDQNAEHAAAVLRKQDVELAKKIKKISKQDLRPLSSMERAKILYNIYNQDMDYRFATGIFDDREVFDLNQIEKQGLSIKDVIGPTGFRFASNFAEIGERYSQSLSLGMIPTELSTNFISDLTDIQSNMLISVTSETINRDKAIALVKNQLAVIEAKVSEIQKRNAADQIYNTLPPDIERAQKNARELLNDITSRNQNLFFCTVVVTVFAKTKEELKDNVKLVKDVASHHICPLKNMSLQQEAGFNTSLPLCRNDVFAERMFTTQSAAVFIPYSAQEMNQKNAVFYGQNQVTKSLIMYDRLSGKNYNGLIFGGPGSGKSFVAKLEMASVLLNHPNSQIFVIDPQGEYYPLTNAFYGQRIRLAQGSKVYLNPLDLNITTDDEDDTDPVTAKSDFIIGLIEILLGKNRELPPVCRSIVDRCVRNIYKPYVDYLQAKGMSCDPTTCPTLSDLYQEFKAQKSDLGDDLAELIEMYAVGSFDTFAHRTNVETDKRFIVYDIKSLGRGMQRLGLYICTSDINNRMIENSKRNIYTRMYVDEFHLLLEIPSIVVVVKHIWKMARKWLGVPTGILQNTEDLLRDEDSRNIVNNTHFVIMLNSSHMDRNNLGTLFNLSDAQLTYITDSDPGYGLIYNGKMTLPFGFDFPKNTMLYKIMTTAHDVKGAKFV